LIRIEEYVSESSDSAFRRWFDDLDPQAAAMAMVTVAIGRLADGNTSNVKPVGEGALLNCELIGVRVIGFISDGTARWS
jgi:putative component of toxin-antitoxin plasmid stabilization module